VRVKGVVWHGQPAVRRWLPVFPSGPTSRAANSIRRAARATRFRVTASPVMHPGTCSRAFSPGYFRQARWAGIQDAALSDVHPGPVRTAPVCHLFSGEACQV
jgi:hypothetical protein